MSLKIHNFLISYPILLKLVLIGLYDFSGSIESKLFLEWTWALSELWSRAKLWSHHHTAYTVRFVHRLLDVNW